MPIALAMFLSVTFANPSSLNNFNAVANIFDLVLLLVVFDFTQLFFSILDLKLVIFSMFDLKV